MEFFSSCHPFMKHTQVMKYCFQVDFSGCVRR